MKAHRTAAIVIAAALAASTASAQYFGRNKVQWEDFDFHVLKTEHFDVYYYPEENVGVEAAARMAERWYARLSEAFDHELVERKPVILYSNHADFQQNTVSGGLIGQGVGGFTESLLNRLVMPLTGTMSDTDHVLGHEMVHVFQFDIAQALMQAYEMRMQPLPLWMTEGLAEYLSTGPVDAHTAMWLRDALLADELPDFDDLNRDPRFFPYRWGHAFWSYVGGRWGETEVVRLYVNALVQGAQPAIEDILDREVESLFEDWHAEIRAELEPVVAPTPVRRQGRRLIGTGEEGQPLNLAPVVSPDGRRVAFLSTRDLFDVDLYLADAATGEVSGRLASARSDPHFDALRFLDSAGAWSPDGSRFAFVVFSEGDNRIAITSTASGDIEQRIEVPSVPAILNLAWSPDGRHLAVAGSEHGVSDLHLVDVATGETRRLTHDIAADLQPAFSPDGRTLAFVTDRAGAADQLAFGPLHLGLLDLASGRTRNLVVFEGAKHISPQFSPDGESLYFISDPDGIANVYRYELASGEAFQVTDVATGVSGITSEAPALSVARDTGLLTYTIFENTEYTVYSLAAEEATGEPVDPATQTVGRRPLPPVEDRRDEELIAAIADPTVGLPPPIVSDIADYSPNLKLAAVGPVSVGTAVDEYGFGVAGGVNAYFTDVLGNHQVGASFSGGTYSDGQFTIGAQATYLNRTNRLGWGAIAARVPYQRAGTIVSQEPVMIGDEQVIADVVEQVREIVTVSQIGAIASYPLSLTRRFEGRAAYSEYDFDATVERLVAVGGTVIDHTVDDFQTRPGYGYSDVSAAYVVDTSYFAFSSPFRGTRMRLELGTVFGDYDFQTVLADYRRYVFFRPAAFAVRLLHFGRYGTDADNPDLAPLNVGQESLIRGYRVGSFELDECTPVPGATLGCAEFERLEGSRLGVINLELRLQALGTESFGLAEFPFAPTELVAFVDVGAAWSEDDPLDLRFDQDASDRVPVFSAGIAARVLLGSYIPIQIYAAHPFQRPQVDWEFGFLIAPGW